MNVLNKIELYSIVVLCLYLVCYLFKIYELFLKLIFGRIIDLYSI